MLGTVKTYKTERGFGFIAPEDGSADVFVHFRALAPGLEESVLVPGARVEFDAIPGDRPGKLQAARVRPAGQPPRAVPGTSELAKLLCQLRSDLLQAGDTFAALIEQARAEGLDV